VLEQVGPHTPAYAIRRAMTEAKVSVGDRRVRFVGVETYEAEGGGILRDLFTEDGGGWLEDVVLLDRLVGERLAGLADEAREREGWKWAEPALDYPDVSAFGRVYPVAVIRSEADAAEITALSEEYDRIVSEAGAEGLPPEADARLEEIDNALQAYGPDFDYAADAKARAGVMVMLGHDGLARFERGLVRAEDAVAPPPEEEAEDDGGDADAGTGGGASEPEEAGSALSDRLVIDLTAHKTMGLRDAVQADVGAALATMVHALALQVFYPGYGLWTPLQLRLTTTGLERLAPGVDDGPAGRRVRDRCEAWGARLPERAEDLWGVVFGLAPSDQLNLMACCAGVGLYAVRDPHDGRPGALAQAETLAMVVGLDMTATWSATAASYFSRVPKTGVLEAVTEAVNAEEAGRIAGFKKGDMAEAAERLVEGKGWLPSVLRTVSDAAEPEDQNADHPRDDDAYAFAAE
jgi:ParB family chromosome partitioning protein